MKYLSSYALFNNINESVDPLISVLDFIKARRNGRSLGKLLKEYPDASQLMNILSDLLNGSQIELHGGKSLSEIGMQIQNKLFV